MPTSKVHICECPQCQQEADHPLKEQHRLMNLFLSSLNKQQRRWYVGIESKRIGRGGDKILSRITGVCTCTISRGRKQLDDALSSGFIDQVQLSNRGGRPRIEKKDPTIEAVLEQMLDNDMAGNPMSEQKWVRISTRRLSERLKEADHKANKDTVLRLLNKMGISMRMNKKKEFRVGGPERSEQFEYIKSQRQAFRDAGLPIISVDTKKKELIGDFKNTGKTWCKKAEEVYEHDFPSLAMCRAVPYGIYDLTRNEGFVFVGTSADTPEFAVDAISRWWKHEGSAVYPEQDQLLILADCGGCNGYRVRGWKQQLQEKLSDKFGLTVTVCHYPTGCSKFNPVERRLFSHISINWAGKPLRTLEVMLGYIRGTNTRTGLMVQAFMQEGSYKRGQRVTKAEMEGIIIQHHTICPDWNYTIIPH